MNSTLFIYQPKSWIFNDEIKSIKFVSTNAKYVYDLSLDEKYCGNKHIFIANDFLAHNSLDSAHGAAKRDFDYFKGLLSFTKKQATTPMIIRLYKKHERNIVTVGNTAKRLIYVDIKPFVKKIELIYDPDITKTRIPEDKTIILLYLEMMTISINTLSKYGLRIVLDKKELLTKGVKIEEISQAITSTYGYLICMAGNVNEKNDVSIRIHMNVSHNTVQTLLQKLSEYDILRSLIIELPKIKIHGIPGVTNAVVDKQIVSNEDISIKNYDRYVIRTTGSNLTALSFSELTDEFIDINNSYTLDPVEMLETRGIYPTIQLLEKEMYETVSQGTMLWRYIMLIVTTMLNRGVPLPYLRGSMTYRSLISRVAFESQWKMIINDSIYGTKADMMSQSDTMMFGQAPFGGTNSFLVMQGYD